MWSVMRPLQSSHSGVGLTSVNDILAVQVIDSPEYLLDSRGSIFFCELALLADAVEELAAEGEVGDEVEVVHGLEVVDEGEDVLMAHGDLFEDGDLVADLV